MLAEDGLGCGEGGGLVGEEGDYFEVEHVCDLVKFVYVRFVL